MQMRIDEGPVVLRRRLNESDIGKLIERQGKLEGILLAPAFRHVTREGRAVGPLMDVFASAQDTRYLTRDRSSGTYEYDIDRIAKLVNICGHRGIYLPTDLDVHMTAEKSPERLSRWHMPTLDLVNGRRIGSTVIQPHNMLAYQNRREFAGTFCTAADITEANIYFTCTEKEPGSSNVWTVRFPNGFHDWDPKDISDLSSRPVRAVPCPCQG